MEVTTAKRSGHSDVYWIGKASAIPKNAEEKRKIVTTRIRKLFCDQMTCMIQCIDNPNRMCFVHCSFRPIIQTEYNTTSETKPPSSRALGIPF